MTNHPASSSPANDPNIRGTDHGGQVKDKPGAMKSSYGASLFGLTFRSRRKS